MKFTTCTLALLIIGAAFSQEAPPPATLKAGDQAPAMDALAWRNGGPINLKNGKIHLIDFWATWCLPCRVGFPTIAKLAKKYEGKVEFASVDVWETRDRTLKGDQGIIDRIDRFLQHSGNVMNFPVAIDKPGMPISNAWLADSSGAAIVPTVVVVDGNGKVLWKGSPTYVIEEVLDYALAGKLTPELGYQINEKAEYINALYSDFNRQADDAIKAKEWAKAYSLANKLDKFHPPFPQVNKYIALLNHDKDAARTFGETVLKDYSDSPLVLVQFAHATLENTATDALPDDAQFALKMLKAAEAYSEPDEAGLLRDYATAYAKTGNKEQAVKKQQELIDRLTAHPTAGYDMDAAKKTLEAYKK